jgi:hypothetical protein
VFITACGKVPSRLYAVSVSSNFPCKTHAFFSESLSNHCHDLHLTGFEICTKFDAVPLSDPSRNRIWPDTRLQTKGREIEHIQQEV